MPSSLHMAFALMSASRSLMPQSAPMAQAFSYSGPSTAIFQLWGRVVTVNLSCASPGSCDTLPQAIVQPKHALLATSRVSARVSPLILSAPSSCETWWLFVGSAPLSLMMLTSTAVPYAARPSPVTGCSTSLLFISHMADMNFCGSAMGTPPVPRTAMALRFFEPMTAPTPDRPAARCRSLTMAAKRTRFSPAGPIQVTTVSCCPDSSRTISSVSQTVLPHRCSAEQIRTSSSQMEM